MTHQVDLERTVSDWLHQQSEWSSPTYLDDILVRTGRTRQRPRWRSRSWWLPMSTVTRLPSARAVSQVLVAIALLAALVGILLSAGGPRLPAPFGPAGNGAILFGTPGGDLARFDIETRLSTTIVEGAAWDGTPDFSHDGTRVIFARRAEGDLWVLMVAKADGTGAMPITGAIDPTWNVWSPDDSSVAVVDLAPSTPTLAVYAVDGSSMTVLDIGGARAYGAAFSADGAEVHFLGSDRNGFGLYAADATGTGPLRTILPPVAGAQTITNPILSPDGRTWAYTRWEDRRSVIHLVDLATTVDTAVALDAASEGENTAAWTPDGRLVFHRHLAGSFRLAVADLGGRSITLLGPEFPSGTGGATVIASPDGSQAIATYATDGSHWLLDLSGGPGTRIDLPASATFSWQRVAL